MNHRFWIQIGCVFIAIIAIAESNYAQKNNKNISVVGCYSDLHEISEGIVGNGVINIYLKNGKYTGTFAELSNELGLTHEKTPLSNISYDKRRHTLKFDITFHGYSDGLVKNLSGRVSKAGIKMKWGKAHAPYGRPNPFLSAAALIAMIYDIRKINI